MGFGNAVCANRVVAVTRSDSAAGRRAVKNAREQNAYADMTFGRSLKSLLMLDDGSVVGCGLTGKTILSRMNSGPASSMEDEGSEDQEEIVEEEST